MNDFDKGFLIYKCENLKEYWKMMTERTNNDLHEISGTTVDKKNGDLYSLDDWLEMIGNGSITNSDGHGEFLNSDDKPYRNLSVFHDLDLMENDDFDIVGVMWYNK